MNRERFPGGSSSLQARSLEHREEGQHVLQYPEEEELTVSTRYKVLYSLPAVNNRLDEVSNCRQQEICGPG